MVTFLDLQGELDTLHRFKKEMDRSWGAAVDSLLTDYLFTTESIVGDSGLHRRSPTISEHFAYNSRIVHDAYKTGNPSLLAYSLDYAKSDNVDTWLEELGNVKYLGSKNSVVSPPSERCNCHFKLNEKYFDDQNLELYVVNGHIFAGLIGSRTMPELKDMQYGYIGNAASYGNLSRNLEMFFQDALQRDLFHMIFHFSFNDFGQLQDHFMNFVKNLDLMNDVNKWYILLFYRRNLYYFTALQPCEEKKLEIKIE